jgi:endoglucanase
MRNAIIACTARILALSAIGCGTMTALPDEDPLGSGNQGASGGAGNDIGTNTGGDPATNSTGGASGGDDSGTTQPLFVAPVEIHGQLSVSGTHLVDKNGDAVQLKGPSSMWLNWEATGYAENKQGVQWLRDNWKATIIRASMGIEPAGAYLADPAKAKSQVKTVVQNAIDLGMYVIIDWHEEHAQNHQAQSIAFFTEMAQTYGSYPNVIYETFNEPLNVNWTTVLKPYHEAVVAAIRAVDPDNVIVLGTPNYSQYVDVAAQDQLVGSNLMYTLHFYSCTHGAAFRTRGDYAMSLGLPIFVTEWGATNANGGTTGTLCLDEAQLWHDWMNQNKISWTAWKLDDCTDLSCYFKVGAPVDGGWTDDQLNGHGPFVRDRMKE